LRLIVNPAFCEPERSSKPLSNGVCVFKVEKSAVSENFIEASREKVKQLMERPLEELRLCAGLLVAERQRRDVIGYRQIPLQLSSMANAVSSKPIARRVTVA